MSMNIRIIEKDGEYTQTLFKIKSFDISNTDVKVVHINDSENVAEFTSPAVIFVMINKVTIDKIIR